MLILIVLNQFIFLLTILLSFFRQFHSEIVSSVALDVLGTLVYYQEKLQLYEKELQTKIIEVFNTNGTKTKLCVFEYELLNCCDPTLRTTKAINFKN